STAAVIIATLKLVRRSIATVQPPSLDILALDEALTKLAISEPAKAQLVKLRFFAGLTMAEAAEVPKLLAAYDAVFGTLETTTPDDWRKVMEVNVIGSTQLCKSAVPALQQKLTFCATAYRDPVVLMVHRR
ncbi:MAG: hypothetical protein HC863_01480, partial [Myxococcales bacterium]|nr:hypothetical protein [Myxococcales bacterium]